MQLVGTAIIGSGRGEASGETFAARNATTQEALEPRFHAASVADIQGAAQLAAEAFVTFRRWDGKRRGALLRRIAAFLEENAAAIVERAGLETALPAGRLQGEMGRTCGQLRLFATLVEEGSWVDARIDHADPDRKPAPKPDVRSFLAPVGPVAVFSASNFPLAFSVAGGDTASALAAGCPVIVKAHEAHPGTSELVGRLIQRAVRECGAPEGVFSLLQGPGRTVGVSLIQQPGIKAVGFTGSRGAGRALMDAAARRAEPIPVYTEMGSVNPVFLLPEALAERPEAMAAGLHASVTLGVGQFCTNPGLVFIQAGEGGEAFRVRLRELMQSTPPGTMLTAEIQRSYVQGLKRFAGTEGVSLLARATSESGMAAAALTVPAQTFLNHPELLDEVFGPLTLLVECASRDEMTTAARALDGQLTATIHATGTDLAANEALLAILETKVGRLVYNGFPTGVEVGPAMHHGGPYPATGDGRTTSVGTRAIERFVRPVCYQDFPDALLPAELQEGNPLGLRRLVDGAFIHGPA